MIEFIEEEHIYLIGGIIVPSVTQILQKLFPKKYARVPIETLNKKANYGTQLHKYIEIIEKKKPKKPLAYIKRYYDLNIYHEESLRQYLKIKEKYHIEVLESEKIVYYEDKYAGTLDIKALVNGKLAIIDIKTTIELDKNWVSWQNSYYELADEPVEELYCLWLPKAHLGKFEKVERINKEKLLKQLEERNEPSFFNRTSNT